MNECNISEISDEYKHLSHNCHLDADCTNTKGSFYCKCLEGYAGDGVECVGKHSDNIPDKWSYLNVRKQLLQYNGEEHWRIVHLSYY